MLFVVLCHRERTVAMASQIHRLAEANAEFASKSSVSPNGGAAVPNGHAPAEGTLLLPGEVTTVPQVYPDCNVL